MTSTTWSIGEPLPEPELRNTYGRAPNEFEVSPPLQAASVAAVAQIQRATAGPFNSKAPSGYSVSTGIFEGGRWRKYDCEYFEPIAWN